MGVHNRDALPINEERKEEGTRLVAVGGAGLIRRVFSDLVDRI